PDLEDPLEVRHDLGAVGGVAHHRPLVGVLVPGDDHVVHDAARLVADEAVPALARFHLRYVARDQQIDELLGLLAREAEAAHVGDVEEGSEVAALVMLLDDGGVDQRHFPPGERHHPRAAGDVKVVEGRALQFGRGSVGNGGLGHVASVRPTARAVNAGAGAPASGDAGGAGGPGVPAIGGADGVVAPIHPGHAVAGNLSRSGIPSAVGAFGVTGITPRRQSSSRVARAALATGRTAGERSYHGPALRLLGEPLCTERQGEATTLTTPGLCMRNRLKAASM